MLKISVGVETESCLQASMLKDIVQQKERLFASWPFLLLKKQVTTAQSACVDEKKQEKSQAERGNMESRSVRKEDFVKRQVDVKFFLLGRLRPLYVTLSFGNRPGFLGGVEILERGL